LKLNSILNGIVEFSKEFAGKIITETMLIKEINDSEEDIRGVASFLEGINPSEAYISIPIRPPAESRAVSPNEEVLNMAYQIFSQRIKTVKMLITPEEGEFVSTDNTEDDILSIISVHPMREDAVQELLRRRGKEYTLIDNLVKEEKIRKVEYNGQVFYIKKLS